MYPATSANPQPALRVGARSKRGPRARFTRNPPPCDEKLGEKKLDAALFDADGNVRLRDGVLYL